MRSVKPDKPTHQQNANNPHKYVVDKINHHFEQGRHTSYTVR